MIDIPQTRVASSETPYLPVELTSRLATKVAISPLQRLRWLRLVGPLTRPGSPTTDVAVVLAEMAGRGRCWPSLGTLAAASALSRVTVARAVGELEAAKLIQRTQRFNASTVYLLTFPPRPKSLG